jgi:hypothetical protein
MSAGSARLQHTLKTLREKWTITKEYWDDKNAREYDKNHLFPLEQQSTTAIHGMDKIAEVLSKLKHDCS